MVNSFIGIRESDRNVILVMVTFTSGWPVIQALTNTSNLLVAYFGTGVGRHKSSVVNLTYDLSMQHRVGTAVSLNMGFTMGDRGVSVFPPLRPHIS
jgi:hypothetical protein